MHRSLVSSLALRIALVLAAFSTAACGSGSGPDDDQPTVASVTITGVPTSQLVPTETAQLQATVRDNAGAVVTGTTVQWATSSSTIATVDANGLVTAVGEGTASITASASQRTASVNMEVAAGGIVGPAGATITFLGGTATLAIPAAAVAQSVRLILSPATVPPSIVVMQGTAFTIAPTDVVFSKIAVLTQRYDPAMVPVALAESALSLYEATNGTWEQRLGVLNTATRTLTTNIVRGGTYAVVVLPVAFIAISREFRNRVIAVGQSAILQAGVWDANARPLMGRTIQWNSSNPGRASVDAAGRVTGLTTGDVRIVATGDGVSDSVTVTIVPRPVADWSGAGEWTTSGGNPGRNGYVPVTVDPAAIRPLWSVETGAPPVGFVPPEVASLVTGGGRVYINAYNMVLNQDQSYQAAFDGQTGAKLWQRARPAGALAYAQGNVYFHGQDSLWAINAADGVTRFRVPFAGPGSIPSFDAPLVSDNALYMASGGIHRFDLTTGVRTFHTPGTGPATAAVAGPGVVYFSQGQGTGLSAIEATTGNIIFSTNVGSCFQNSVETVVLGSSNNALNTCNLWIESFDLQSRTRAWAVSSFYSGVPAAANGVVYLNQTQPPSIDARRESDGTLLFSLQPFELFSTRLDGKFIVTKNLLIFSATPGFTGSDVNSVWIVDLASRKVIYRIGESGNMALSSQGVLYIATRERKLVAYALK